MFLCVGPNCWGRGLTAKEAVKNARKNLSAFFTAPFSYNLYEGTDRIYVDGVGRIRDFEPPRLLEQVRHGGERVVITEYENDSQLSQL
jgi:hypothetical protein